MGKGGTKFDASAIGSRDKLGGVPTGKERRKDMERFLQTGRHPDLDDALNSDTLPPLPLPDRNRQHVFLEFKQGKRVLGRIVIELFLEELPVAAAEFRKRCSHGAVGGFEGTRIHKILQNLAAFGGRSDKYNNGGVRLKRNASFRHVEKGVVSISLSGDEFLLPFTRTLVHDDTYQVIGQVVKGIEVVDALNEVPTNVEDVPSPPLLISLVGNTDAQGNYESLHAEGAAGKSTAEDAAKTLAREANDAREAVKEALGAVLPKRKADASCEIKGRAVKRGPVMMDSLLGGDQVSSDSSGD